MALLLDLNLIETYSLKSIGFADISNYENITPSNVSFEVTPPGFNKVNIPFVSRAVNVYRSIDLLPGCSEDMILPDGIYTVTYSIQPNLQNRITKSFLRTTQVNSRLQQAYLSLDTECDCKDKTADKRKIQDIKILIEGAIATANNCDPDNAIKMMQRANKKLDQLKTCNC